ncbi:MAG: Ig-like domain-containing protein [Spirochaetales bacterium]|nr:Ig-like domain-containing protein [Spirochaetales bacterium]
MKVFFKALLAALLLCAVFACADLASGQKGTDEGEASRSIEELELLGTSIENGDTEVTVGIPLVATFSGAVDESDLTGDYFSLYDGDGEEITVRLESDGDQVILYPQSKLDICQSYTAYIYDSEITFTNDDLDFGLYWYGQDGACEKYFAEYDNGFYDEDSPTLVHAHGWQSGTTEDEEDVTFLWEEDDFEGSSSQEDIAEYVNNSWIDQGWNTGIVYWDQFADEDSLYAAEAKIWDLIDGDEGSRYCVLDAEGDLSYEEWDRSYTFNGTEYTPESIIELLTIPLSYALSQNSSDEFRLTGHSLGNQVATGIAFELYQEGIEVERLALLDPAWTSADKSYLDDNDYGDWTGEVVRYYIFEMIDEFDLAVEIYHTTALNTWLFITDSNDELLREICDINLAPWYYSATQFSEKHSSAFYTYMWSMEYDPPTECTISWWIRYATGDDAAYASTSTSRIREMMGTGDEWTQVEGRYTATPEDDWFEID